MYFFMLWFLPRPIRKPLSSLFINYKGDRKLCAKKQGAKENQKILAKPRKSPFHKDFIARPPIFRTSLLKYYIIHLPQDHLRKAMQELCQILIMHQTLDSGLLADIDMQPRDYLEILWNVKFLTAVHKA